MKDWMFTEENYICDLRVAGVLIKKDKLLVQKDRNGNEFAIPGGHVKIGEVMTDSLIREFMEEIDVQITCIRLLWTEECFWESNGRKVHNLSFYYLVELCSGSDVPDCDEFIPQKDNNEVLIGWVPIKMLGQMSIYPEFIKQAIHHIDAPAAHFITQT